MKTLLRCSLTLLAMVLSGSALTEDGADRQPLQWHYLQPDESASDDAEAFSEMLEQQPTAAGPQTEPMEPEPEPKQHHSPGWPHLLDRGQK